MSPQPTVAGVDGCRGGWVVARTSTVRGAPVAVAVHPTLDDAVADLAAGRLAALAVDMPIGLPADDARPADGAARSLLGPRRSSLFPTPPYAVLDATDHADANARSRAASGKGLSIQAFHLLPKMRELARLAHPDLQPRLAEVHPETSFAVLRGAPCDHPKSTRAGQDERVAALRGEVAEESLHAAVRTRLRGAQVDDVLDAIVAAWTARRIASGTAIVLGDADQRDGRGLRCTIVA